MKDCIAIYDNVFSDEDCDELIGIMEHLSHNNIMTDNTSPNHNIDHKEINFHHNYNLPSWSSVGEKFFPIVKPIIDDYINYYSILNKSQFLFYDIKAKKIPVGGGFHDWHYESSTLISSSRALVLQVYLNDDFEAGETEFLYLNKRVEAKKGRVIIFPTAFTHTHRGNPPIGGDKYILTTWGCVQ